MPRKQRFVVSLTPDERSYLQQVTTDPASPGRKILHAKILLLADRMNGDESWTDERIAEALSTSAKTVGRVRERHARFGLPRAIERKEHSQYKPRRLDARALGRLAELIESPPPDGRRHWTLRLLAERLVALEIVDEISHETVRRHLRELRDTLLPNVSEIHALKASTTAAA